MGDVRSVGTVSSLEAGRYASLEVCGVMVGGPVDLDPVELAQILRTPLWVAQSIVASGHSPFQTEDESTVCAGCTCGWAEGTFALDVEGRDLAAVEFETHLSGLAAKVEMFGPDAAS